MTAKTQQNAQAAAAKIATSRAAAPSGRATTSPKSKTVTKRKPAAPAAASGAPEVAPFLNSDELLAVGDRWAAREGANADAAHALQTQAAQAYSGMQDAGIQRTAGRVSVDNNAGARGLQHSSIRDAGLDKVDADAARRIAALQSGLALSASQADENAQIGRRADQTFNYGIQGRAIENAASIPRTALGTPAAAAAQAVAQRKAKNVKGAVTLRRK